MPRIEVAEYGSRPSFLTPARLNAPQGAKAIADLAYKYNVADYMMIAIDWDGTHFKWDKNFTPKPILYIYATKYFQNINRNAYIELPIDIEEAFGESNFTNTVAVELLQHIAEQFDIKAYESTNMNGAN